MPGLRLALVADAAVGDEVGGVSLAEYREGLFEP